MNFILAIDQGTTSCRAIIYDLNFNVISQSQKEITQFFPKKDWVEHDAEEIWIKQLQCCKEAIELSNINIKSLSCIGITNQRETIVAWNKKTGKPIYRAIVWQDRRTSDACEQDKLVWTEDAIKQKTGLSIDAYFSASKMRWILNHIPEAKTLQRNDALCIGTIDSWILWNLTGGHSFKTDRSNASRTNLFNIKTNQWDSDLMEYYQIPSTILPEVVDSIGKIDVTSSHLFGAAIPISGIAGDQQAALYGHACFETGMTKNTFGTGCFILQNIGDECKLSGNGLLTTIAWSEKGRTTYALEGSVFNAGSALQWLKEGMQIIDDYEEIEPLCKSVKDTEDVILVPAFSGLGTPYWDMYARATLIGMTRGTTKAHIVRATVESLAYQSKDVIDTMIRDTLIHVKEMKVDGGVTKNYFFLQFLSDILQVPIRRSQSTECTALGAAMMAIKGIELYDTDQLLEHQKSNISFYPTMKSSDRNLKYSRWADAVLRAKGWVMK